MSKVISNEPWSPQTRLYNRKKSDIERLLQDVEVQMNIQYLRYVARKENSQRKDMMRALLKYTRAKAVHDTVRWVAVERGAPHPLKGELVSVSTPNNRQ